MKKIVILGTGFGSYSLIRDLDMNRHQVVLISPRNYFLFTPLLPSTAVGTLEFRSIIEPIRRINPRLTYYHARALSINFDARVVHCQAVKSPERFSVSFDTLVIGVGATPNTFGIPGVRKYASFLKELWDARKLRNLILNRFEMAALPQIEAPEQKRLLHTVVVGGGPTGIEFAAEIHDFLLKDVCCTYPQLKQKVRITLLEAGPTILGSFDTKLRTRAYQLFKRQHIDIRLGTAVTKISRTYLDLASGERVDYGILLWATGNAPRRFSKALDLPKDHHGFILVDDHLQIPNRDQVFALGDCAVVEGKALPASAQVAMQQGKYLAKQFNSGKTDTPFKFRMLGMMAYVGEDQALVDTGTFKGSGHLAWFFWRSAYLTRLVRWRNKIKVIVDWIMTTIFGRDTSQF
ncbi:MAG: FAD-dependent oxidoreductase [FCB group bacterium]|nr:FAD-dependent oxidoreductase [FCB group bacterium]